jgi:hypothetical protein
VGAGGADIGGDTGADAGRDARGGVGGEVGAPAGGDVGAGGTDPRDGPPYVVPRRGGCGRPGRGAAGGWGSP